MKKFIVIGNPIKHSLSPLVHNHWFEKNKVEASYEKKQLEDSDLKNIAQEIREEKISGINITVPFKQKIIPFLDELSQIAQATNSVNTVYKKNNKIIGDNTDVSGFQTSLLENAEKKQIKSALLIGAGGVSPSIIHALKDLNVEEIFLTNRTDDKFGVLRNNFGPILKQVLWKDFPHTKFSVDLVVNATSLGLKEKETLNFNFFNISKKTIFYDVIYNPSQTDFLKKAHKEGHQAVNGLMMFLYQAQSAYQIWNGGKPAIDQELLNLVEKKLND